MAQAPAVHAVLDVGGTAARKLITVGSALMVVWPDCSIVIIPVPGITSFELRNARSSVPLESHEPLVACHKNSGIESDGNAVIPETAVHGPEQFTVILFPTVKVPELAT